MPNKKNTQKPVPEKKSHYKIYQANTSSFGYWIIPLIFIIIIGAMYIALKLLIQNPGLLGQKASTTNDNLENIEINNDITNNRQRAGNPINTNETNWGKGDPFSPAN